MVTFHYRCRKCKFEGHTPLVKEIFCDVCGVAVIPQYPMVVQRYEDHARKCLDCNRVDNAVPFAKRCPRGRELVSRAIRDGRAKHKGKLKITAQDFLFLRDMRISCQ